MAVVMRYWVAAVASLMPLVGCPAARPQDSGSSAAAGYPEAGAEGAGPLRTVIPVRYYVAPDGSDSSPGTLSAPFRTLQRASEMAGPGDTVIARAGTYTGGSRLVGLERGGAPGAWITYRSERKGAALLDGRDGRSDVGWYFGPRVAYVRVEGFEVRGFREHGFDFYGGGVHDILIAENRVHHIGRYCTDTSNGRTGASLGAGAHRITFDGNVWFDIGRLVPGEGGCAPRTEHYQNHDHGIYVAEANEITIRNNLFLAFSRGWAIHRYSSRGFESTGLVVVNNTFVGRNPYRPGQIILATPTVGLRIENNIFYGPKGAALYFENLRFPAGLVRNNMIHQGVTKVGKPRGVRFSRNWENIDPRLIDEVEGRLRPESPAIDVGLPLAEVTHDADGAARPNGQGYDLGAYER